MKKFLTTGPAILVTAAFIGPGTVITASRAGAEYGHALVWALVFSTFATLVLQEMAARLGIVSGKGLGENIREGFNNVYAKYTAILLVTSAIVMGNAAYQGGNITGAVLAIAPIIILPDLFSGQVSIWPLILGLFAFFILWRGQYYIIEKALKVLVGLMSIAFVITFIITKPQLGSLLSGLIPSIPDGATLTVIALVGTTVVPYNLFLHASSAAEKWHDANQIDDNLDKSRHDLRISIPLGGLISIAILSTAASAFCSSAAEIKDLATLAPSLQPLVGNAAPYIMATGLFAAGISSAITAPLAAAFALRGVLGLDVSLNHWQFRAIWLVILLLGVGVSSLQLKPVSIIWFAQVANGILLPIITVYLLWIMNSDKLGEHRNTSKQNIIGLVVLLTTLLLSGRSLSSAFGLI